MQGWLEGTPEDTIYRKNFILKFYKCKIIKYILIKIKIKIGINRTYVFINKDDKLCQLTKHNKFYHFNNFKINKLIDKIYGKDFKIYFKILHNLINGLMLINWHHKFKILQEDMI